jgi:hypothetical protein
LRLASKEIDMDGFSLTQLASGLRAMIVPKLNGLFSTFTLPEADGTFATLAGTETLTNKTLTAPALTAPVITGLDTIPIGTVGAGTKSGATVTVVERNTGIIHQSVFTFTAFPLTVPNAVAGTQGIGAKFYDFPEGRIAILGATGSMAETTTSIILNTLNGGVTAKWGVGTTIGTNATLATTEQDLIPVTSITSSATINVAGAVSNAALSAPAQFDGTGTAKAAFLNFSVPTDGDLDADATITLTGTVTITWINLGDY